ELDIFIDSQNQILSRIRVTLLAIQHMPAGIKSCQHAAGNPVQVAVELALHASEAIVIGADVSQDLRGKLAVGIEALEFLLEIHAFEIQRLYPGDFCGSKFARDP